MRKSLLFTFILVSLILFSLIFGVPLLGRINQDSGRSGIRVESNQASGVLIDRKEVGKTPLQIENLNPGDHLVEVKGNDGQSSWQGLVKLNSGTLTYVNRELSKTQTSSAGDVISLEKGKGVSILSNPTGAQVSVDGQDKGFSPIWIDELSPGEHLFMLTKGSFTPRTIRSVVTQGYRLNISVDLLISSVDVTKIDTPPVLPQVQLVVIQTPTGFLRVRSAPDINSSEVARVSPGDKLTQIEDLTSWKKVKLTDGKEGYVSSSYVEKTP